MAPARGGGNHQGEYVPESRSAALDGVEQVIAQRLAREPLIDIPVLIVEDDPLVGQFLQDLLMDRGYRPVGPAPTLSAAKEAIADNALAAALLDIRLDGNDRSFELAEILTALRIPFAFLSSYSAALIPHKFREVPLLAKPFTCAEVLSLLTMLIGDAQKPECAVPAARDI